VNHSTNGSVTVHTHIPSAEARGRRRTQTLPSRQLKLRRARIASFLILFSSMILGWSCEKEALPDISAPADVNSAIENRSIGGVLSGSGETVLGNVLNNPYALDNINQAYQMLRGSTGNLQPTHYYLKWVPQTGEHIEALEAFEEAYGYEFETQPIHFEVVYEGTENYVDPAIGENGFSPE
jgi:hypothetical protein